MTLSPVFRSEVHALVVIFGFRLLIMVLLTILA